MSKNLPAIQEKTNSVRGALEKMKPQLEMALPAHVTPDRLLRVTMTAIQNNPKLLDCDRKSLFSAIMSCAQLGLVPDGILGQAYLIPFKVQGNMQCQFIPGYKGLLTLARNSGDVTSIQANAVHENDHFEYQYGLNEKLDHKPASTDRGEITHFYAIARFKDGGHHWDVMTREDVEAIRDGSQGYQAAVRFKKNDVINSPWVSHFGEMGRKTLIRRIAKYLPMDVQKAAYLSQSLDTGQHSYLDNSGGIIVTDAESEVVDEPKLEDKSALDQFATEDKEAEQETPALLLVDQHGEEFSFETEEQLNTAAMDAVSSAGSKDEAMELVKNNAGLEVVNAAFKEHWAEA